MNLDRRDRRLLAAAVGGAALWLVPFLRYELHTLDEGVIFTFADAIRLGNLPYRDFYCQYAPAVFYLTAALQALAGFDVVAGRVAVLLLFCLSTAACYLAARSVVPPGAALLACAVHALLGPAYDTTFTYNRFAVVLGWLTLLALLGPPTRARLLAAGLLCGLHVLFKQNSGAYVAAAAAGVAAWTAREEGAGAAEILRREGLLLLGLAAGLAPLGYFLAVGAGDDLLECLLFRNLRWARGSLSASALRPGVGAEQGLLYHSYHSFPLRLPPALWAYAILRAPRADQARRRSLLVALALSLAFFANLVPVFSREYLNRWFGPHAVLFAFAAEDLRRRAGGRAARAVLAGAVALLFVHLAATTVYHRRRFVEDLYGFRNVEAGIGACFRAAEARAQDDFADTDVLAVFYYHLYLYHRLGRTYPTWYTRMNASNWTGEDFSALVEQMEAAGVTRVWMDNPFSGDPANPDEILARYLRERFEGPRPVGSCLREWRRRADPADAARGAPPSALMSPTISRTALPRGVIR